MQRGTKSSWRLGVSRAREIRFGQDRAAGEGLELMAGV